MKLASLVKSYPEKYFGKLFSWIFWPPPTVAVLAHGENDDILVLNLDGNYRLPGGFMDKDEELKEAAKREVKEETGFEVEVTRLLDVEKNGSGGPEIFFEAEVSGGEKDGSWEGKPEFLPKEKVKQEVWHPKHHHIHEYLFPGD